MLVSFILGIDRDRGVAEHGFGAGRGDFEEGVLSFHIIFNMPEIPVLFGVVDLDVRKSGLAVRAPVYNSAASVYEIFVVEVYENFVNRLRALFVHCERKARPVARRAHFFELFDYSARVFILPRPRAFQKALSADALFGQPLGFHLLDDFDLGRDRRVVGAGQPEGAIALHTLEAYYGVLHGLVHCVPHVELSRYVGGRHHYRERYLVVVAYRFKTAAFLPFLVKSVFEFLRVVSFFHYSSSYT